MPLPKEGNVQEKEEYGEKAHDRAEGEEEEGVELRAGYSRSIHFLALFIANFTSQQYICVCVFIVLLNKSVHENV